MIDENDINRLREIFMSKADCRKNTDVIKQELAFDATKLAVIESKLNQVTWLLTAVSGGIITMLIKMFFGA